MRGASWFCAIALLAISVSANAEPQPRKTTISIEGQTFVINGKPTFPGREYKGMKVEGLLPNSRMVQGIFDDLNPGTRSRWTYPDGPWDADRNTREFIAAMPEWRAQGLLSFTICLEGGSPEGYSKDQPWHNSAFTESGDLRPDYMTRLERILDQADELGMAPIVGFFYFGQAPRFTNEGAVRTAVEAATDWLLEKGYTNVLVEIGNESDHGSYPPSLRAEQVHQWIEVVKQRSAGRVKSPAGRLLVSTSFTGGKLPTDEVVKASDFLLLHGNGVGQPGRIREMVDGTRLSPNYRNQPIVFNEDDHFDFEKPDNNFLAALSRYSSWGYFDFRKKGESFEQGYQSVPVDWGINSDRKRSFFKLLAEITGSR
jgi:hypothetical protein